MIEFRLTVDALGSTRFAYSPLAEVASSVRLLGQGAQTAVMAPWLRDMRHRLGRINLPLLQAIAPPGNWAPDFLFAWSHNPQVTIEQQLDALSRTPADTLRADLEACWQDHSRPRALQQLLAADPDQLAGEIASVIWSYWQVAIAAHWSRIRAVLDDDVAYRGALAFTDGIFAMFADLHSEVTLVDRTLKIDKPHHRNAIYDGSQITLLPSVFVWPNLIIGHERPNAFSLTYAARGVGRVWQGMQADDQLASSLESLIGRSRAAILRHLEIPMTTTQLARQLRQSPGTVSEHLGVLRENGLLSSWRSGRSVLYRRTALASSVLAAADARTSQRAHRASR